VVPCETQPTMPMRARGLARRPVASLRGF
jgi:hypothetical protein